MYFSSSMGVLLFFKKLFKINVAGNPNMNIIKKNVIEASGAKKRNLIDPANIYSKAMSVEYQPILTKILEGCSYLLPSAEKYPTIKAGIPKNIKNVNIIKSYLFDIRYFIDFFQSVSIKHLVEDIA